MLFFHDGYGALYGESVDTDGVATSHIMSVNDACECKVCIAIHSVGWKVQGDTTFISWLMVMTRKYVLSPSFHVLHANFDIRHYFKTQCIYVASHRPVRHRSRASLLASISRPVRAFQNQDVVPPRKTSPIQAQEVDITKGPTIEITEKNSEQQFAFDSASNPDANVAVFSSSPTPFSIPLPSSHPPSHLELIEEASVTSPDVLRQRRVLTFRGTLRLRLLFPLF